jgi:dienelactone hydrolase
MQRAIQTVLLTVTLGILPGAPLRALDAAADTAQPIVTVNPVVLRDAAQNKDTPLRVTAPLKGDKLPIILFSHGAQYSKDDYLPLTEFWASHGYLVIQPTHIEALALGLSRDDPRVQMAWKSRILDMRHILDSLDDIEREVPALKGRLDRAHVIAAGHSFGGHTSAALIGARMPDIDADYTDRRISAGLMLAPPGKAPGFRNVAWRPDARPALVIVGLDDVIPGFNDDWRAHADYYYDRSGGPQCLLGMSGMKHYLGGILGTHRTEDTAPSPASVAQIERVSLAFLDAQTKGSRDWDRMRGDLLISRPAPIGVFECK